MDFSSKRCLLFCLNNTWYAKMLTLLDSKCEEIILDGGESCGLQNSLSGQLCSPREYKNSQK